jgi:hypothetical protein
MMKHLFDSAEITPEYVKSLPAQNKLKFRRHKKHKFSVTWKKNSCFVSVLRLCNTLVGMPFEGSVTLHRMLLFYAIDLLVRG